MKKDDSSKEKISNTNTLSSLHLDSTESSDFCPNSTQNSTAEPNVLSRSKSAAVSRSFYLDEVPTRPKTAKSGPSCYREEFRIPSDVKSSSSNFEPEPVLTARSRKSVVVREVLNSCLDNACRSSDPPSYHLPTTSRNVPKQGDSKIEFELYEHHPSGEVYITQHVVLSEPNMRTVVREHTNSIRGAGVINSTSAMHSETLLTSHSRHQSFTRVPPSYSTVLKLGPATVRHSVERFPQLPSTMSSFPFIPRQPPPSYAEVQLGGDWGENPSAVSSESFSLGPNPIYAACPRCRTIVRTDIHTERSHLSHVLSAFLCICFCWPCCLLPYCLKQCQNTYHFCPTCHYYMGVYRPC